MIKYSLCCEKDHEFEGWFASSDEFSRLASGKLLDCPVCGSMKIEKMLMAPSVKSTKGKEIVASPLPVASGETAAAGSVPAVAGPQMPTMPAEIQQEIIKHLREVKKHVLANAENVGEKFGEEARKIHYGESEVRGIYGQTTPDEAVELMEEGISIMPLPLLPEDKN